MIKSDHRDRAAVADRIKRALTAELSKRGLDSADATLLAGSALYFHGLRDRVADIDFVHPKLKKFVAVNSDGYDLDGGPGGDLPAKALKFEIKHGLRMQTKPALLSFYKTLNRPKDQEKIEQLTRLCGEKDVTTHQKKAAAMTKSGAFQRSFHDELRKLAGNEAGLLPSGKPVLEQIHRTGFNRAAGTFKRAGPGIAKHTAAITAAAAGLSAPVAGWGELIRHGPMWHDGPMGDFNQFHHAAGAAAALGAGSIASGTKRIAGEHYSKLKPRYERANAYLKQRGSTAKSIQGIFK